MSVIERMAKAIHHALMENTATDPTPWDQFNEACKEIYRRQAEAALRAFVKGLNGNESTLMMYRWDKHKGDPDRSWHENIKFSLAALLPPGDPRIDVVREWFDRGWIGDRDDRFADLLERLDQRSSSEKKEGK